MSGTACWGLFWEVDSEPIPSGNRSWGLFWEVNSERIP